MEKIITTLIGVAITILLVMLIWNVTVVDVFGLPKISYLQAAGLWVITKLFIYKYGSKED